MTDKTLNNEPIHPCAEGISGFKGLRLRDYFAAQSITGILGILAGSQWGPDEVAKRAYATADAMMAERSKP